MPMVVTAKPLPQDALPQVLRASRGLVRAARGDADHRHAAAHRGGAAGAGLLCTSLARTGGPSEPERKCDGQRERTGCPDPRRTFQYDKPTLLFRGAYGVS